MGVDSVSLVNEADSSALAVSMNPDVVAVGAKLDLAVGIAVVEAESSPMLKRLQAKMEKANTPNKNMKRFLDEMFIDIYCLLSIQKVKAGRWRSNSN